MSAKTEYAQVLETVGSHQQRLEKIRSLTASFRQAALLDKALYQLKKLIWELEANKPAVGKPWTRPADLDKIIDEATKVENEALRWHSRVGWIWFAVFALGFLALVDFYLYFHWTKPGLEIKNVSETVGGATVTSTITRNVFFWKDIPLKFAEVAFWIAFGLFTFILYNIQHWVRQKNDVGLWGQWYFSKLLQGVVIGFVIILFFIEFKFTVAGLDVDFSSAPMPVFVILAFILGYYSDKARDYLDVIQNRFLSGTDIPEVEIEAPREGLAVTSDKVVVKGKVTGPQGMKGTLVIGKGEPVAINLDSGGNFGHLVELTKGVNLIKVEATSPNGKVGSKSIQVTQIGPGLVLTLAPLPAPATGPTGMVSIQGSVKDDLGTPIPGISVWLLTEGKEPLRTVTDTKGNFSQDVPLAPGKNVIRVLAARPEGNAVMESAEVNYEGPG